MKYKKEVLSSEKVKRIRFVWKEKDIETKPKKEEELEESVALALQNYRSGLIDADDLVAFLLPVRLEEDKPGIDLAIVRLGDEDSE